MNRSNIGNIVTNAAQTIGIGATTAGGLRRQLAKANESLNNKKDLSVDDLMSSDSVVKAKKKSLTINKNEYIAEGNNNKDKNNDLNTNKNVSSTESIDFNYESNSEQIEDIKNKLINDSKFLKMWIN